MEELHKDSPVKNLRPIEADAPVKVCVPGMCRSSSAKRDSSRIKKFRLRSRKKNVGYWHDNLQRHLGSLAWRKHAKVIKVLAFWRKIEARIFMQQHLASYNKMYKVWGMLTLNHQPYTIHLKPCFHLP